ncbi:MAG: 30S ribosomal protein S8 [Clostridia bacterium]|jgi:small subunit ribosomal protein S8|nr:30S ribosomal protein S8 [Clostridia bacterium]MBR3885307.1 30S ribosomal protein S8 [Clostridia bacterium]
MVNDSIADLLTRIRNAQTARHETVSVETSIMKKSIVQILLDEGYISSFEEVDNGKNKDIVITLKYVNKNQKVITGLKRISKPGRRIYASCEELPKVLNGLGIVIVSTSKGVMTDREARKLGIGGEVLAYVW